MHRNGYPRACHKFSITGRTNMNIESKQIGAMLGGSSLLVRYASFFCTPNIYFTKPMMKQMKDPEKGKKKQAPTTAPHRRYPRNRTYLALLLGDTDGPTPTTGGLGVLTTDTETPVVTKTTVSADLLQALEIITELGVDTVGENLVVLAIDDIALSVEEPGGNLVLGGVLDDGDDALKLFGGEFTGTGYQAR
jgi:hypothetical protein